MNGNNLTDDILTFQNDFIFFQKHIQSFRKKHLNQFVAIHDKKIIGAAQSVDKLKKELSKQKIDIAKVVVEFVPKEETLLVL